MFAAVPNPIPARMKGLNRAELCDQNFTEFVQQWSGTVAATPAPGGAVIAGAGYAWLPVVGAVVLIGAIALSARATSRTTLG